MTLIKTPVQLISNQTIVASGTYVSPNSIDLSAAIDLVVGYTVTFNSLASNNSPGIRIEMFGDPGSSVSNFTVSAYDNPIDAVDVPVSAGHTVFGNVAFNRSLKYAKFRVTNLSGSYSVTYINVFVTIQTQ